MSNEDTKSSLSVTIADQTFRVRATAEEAERFKRIENRANDAIAQVQSSGILGGPRVMAMTIFQLMVELDEAREILKESQDSRDRLNRLISRIDSATGAGKK